MVNHEKNKWKDLIDEYVWIEDKIKIPLLSKALAVLVLEVHPSGKKVKLRSKGIQEEDWYYISHNGELKKRWYSISPYKFVRLLSKWEKLEFEVADYISDVSENIDFDSKTITECKYMKQYAIFEMEQYLPMKSIALFLIGLMFSSNASYYTTITTLPMWTAWLLSFIFYIGYHNTRSKFHEIILKIEARILSEI